jgi:alanine dehydrogenase
MMTGPPYIDAGSIASCLCYTDLISSLRSALAQDHTLPERLNYSIGEQWGIDARLLFMLAWREDFYVGFKIVTFHPENSTRGLPSLAGIYGLLDGQTGQPLALLDAAELTAHRTAAASVLAAQCLTTHQPPKNVLIIGAGKLSSYYIKAYAEIMRPEKISLWNRDAEKAERIINATQLSATKLQLATNLEEAVREADIISTLTSSTQPVLFGAWCKPGCHIDLVGGYHPDMREADDELIQRAMIYVDTYQGALNEAGDIKGPLERDIITQADIKADLAELVRGEIAQLSDDKDLTVFKSIGAAFEDLAAAVLVYEKTQPQGNRSKNI